MSYVSEHASFAGCTIDTEPQRCCDESYFYDCLGPVATVGGRTFLGPRSFLPPKTIQRKCDRDHMVQLFIAVRIASTTNLEKGHKGHLRSDGTTIAF